MPCMCGDTNCPSCGPAQGYDPAFETVCDWFLDKVLADFPRGIDTIWLAEELANRLGHRDQSQDLADAVYAEAQRWNRSLASSVRPAAKSIIEVR